MKRMNAVKCPLFLLSLPPLHASEKKGYADNVKLGVCAAHCFYYHMTTGDDALAHKVLKVLGLVERLFANSSSAISGSRDDLNRM
jgi:hypothetical protein